MAKDGITIAGAEGVYGMLFDVGDDFYVALYDGAKLDENTGGYTAIGEVSGQGYTAGGKKLSTPSDVEQQFPDCRLWPDLQQDARAFALRDFFPEDGVT
jgi:hypothetical protein